MSNNDSKRWIRTSSGYAGRNGFIVRSGRSITSFTYEANPQAVCHDLVSDAKKYLDSLGKEDASE